MNHQKTPDLHKRHWLRAASGTLAALVLAACSPSGAPSADKAGAASAAATWAALLGLDTGTVYAAGAGAGATTG